MNNSVRALPTGSPKKQAIANPDFDDDRVIWEDGFSGSYEPAPYDKQFDDQWRFFMEQKVGFHAHTGVETTDAYIDDRIEELTGVEGYLARKRYGALYPFN